MSLQREEGKKTNMEGILKEIDVGVLGCNVE
jgi:hypothetical protein